MFKTSEGYSPPGRTASMFLLVVVNLQELEEHPDCPIELTYKPTTCPIMHTRICQHMLTHACMCATAKFVGVSSAFDALQHLSKSMSGRDWLWMTEFKP